jgi:hypothetical protein
LYSLRALSLHSVIGFQNLDFCLSALRMKLQNADSVIVPAHLGLFTTFLGVLEILFVVFFIIV